MGTFFQIKLHFFYLKSLMSFNDNHILKTIEENLFKFHVSRKKKLKSRNITFFLKNFSRNCLSSVHLYIRHPSVHPSIRIRHSYFQY